MLILLIVGLIASVLFTAMSLSLRSLSTSHLRYWARRGEAAAKALYPLKARGSAVLLTLELFRALTISATLVLLAEQLWGLYAWLVGAIILYVIFIVLSELYLKPIGTRLLVTLSPLLLSLAHLLRFIMLPLGRIFDRFIAEQPVTMTRTDLTHMIDTIEPGDTDLSDDELRVIKHALSFGDKKVLDIMTPRSVMSVVRENDILSPIVLDELHKTGHSRFPVLTQDGEQAIGILYVRDLFEAKAHAEVKELMHKPIHFVNEVRELDHVLQAFLRTKQHLFLVVNSFAEITGLVTIEDVVEQVLGKPIIDEFDKYDSMRDVAEAKAKIVRKQINVVE
jgi:CBS domain containing-hemolysin-like protein